MIVLDRDNPSIGRTDNPRATTAAFRCLSCGSIYASKWHVSYVRDSSGALTDGLMRAEDPCPCGGLA